jgi:D-inositol-3-phosphate glycosyltransferase
MKVGLVGTHPGPGVGRPQSVHGSRLAALAGALADRNVEVTVYSYLAGTSRPEAVDSDTGYRVVYLPGPGSADDSSDAVLAPVMGDFARFLVDRWAVDRPQVVHAGSWMYGVAAQLAASRHGIATVQSLSELSGVVHRRQGRQLGPVTRARFERLLARSATRVTASCTEDVVEVARLGCPRGRVSVLPQAVDTELFSPVGATDLRTSERRIVAVARELAPYKGLESVIAAIARLPATELIIVGGPHREQLSDDADARRLRTLAAGRGVANRVHLTGGLPMNRLPGLLRSADAYACASWYEPFGLPVLEAMACGVPVVATAAGGMLDTIIDDVTGFLVPPRSAGDLAKALGEVLNGGVLRNGMGMAGMTRARSRYSWDRIAAEAQTIYERAADEVGRHPAVDSVDRTQAVGA